MKIFIFCFFISGSIFADSFSSNKIILAKIAKKYKYISAKLAYALALAETTGLHFSQGKVRYGESKEIGILQVKIFHQKKGEDIYKLRDNINAGLRFLNRRIAKRQGNIFLALIDYNCGPRNGTKFIDGEYRLSRHTRRYLGEIILFLSLH